MNGRCYFSSSASSLSRTLRLASSSSCYASLTSTRLPGRNGPPPPPLLLRTSSSLLPRRRHRRNHRRASTNPFHPRNPTSPSSTRKDEEVDVSFSLDIDETLSRASASLRRFYRNLLASGAEAYDDLRSSVRVDHESRRIGFSCRRSSLVFAANVLFSFLVAVVSARVIRWLFGRFFWSSWRGGGRWSVIKRDRSLGGRQVVVGRRSSASRKAEMQMSPLSPGKLSGLTKRYNMVQRKQRTRERVPEWWPTGVSSVSPTNRSSYLGMEDSQREASMLVRAIMDKRMNGRDYEDDDIIQLRQICRASGVRVHFDTANARDSFFRAAVAFALKICSRAGQSTASIRINGEDIRQFLAGLAYNIGLEDVHAAVLLFAAVAAKTRSCFLQALALDVQGKRSEALEELSSISCIHLAFPPEDQSPEIEMVASGLQKNLKLEQRVHLLNLLEEASNVEGRRTAAKALGLQTKLKNSEDAQTST